MTNRDVAVLILYNEKGEILLQHRSEDAKRNPNHWGFFGGGIDGAETPEETVKREIAEELEYKVADPVLFSVGAYSTVQIDGGRTEGTRYTFLQKYDTTQKLVQHEGQGMGWFLPSDTNQLLMTESAGEVVEKVGKYLESQPHPDS